MNNITYEDQKELEMVKQDGMLLTYVHNQTPEICLEAVRQNSYALQYIHNQTPELCLEAVKQDGYALPSNPQTSLLDASSGNPSAMQ